MANADLIVALVALAASIVALLISTTQLFAEIFATAEGRRKTSSTVMGPFGRLSEKNLKATELRFEIHYISPHLVLNEVSRTGRVGPLQLQQLEKDKSLQYETFYALDGPQVKNYVMVGSRWRNHGWQILFHNIREYLIASRDHGEAPTIELRDRAWDELPDDVGGPVASTELFDILVIARRLGAIWQRFDSLSDVLRAEGNGHVFFSTEIRGLGRALSYQYVGPAKKEIRTTTRVTAMAVTARHVSRHWNSNAVKFMFGICPGNFEFDLRDYVIRETNDLKLIWNNYSYLELPWQEVKGMKKRWKDLFKEKIEIELRHATNDLIALNCPMIRPSPSSPERPKAFDIGQVLLPFAGNFENMFQGLSIDRDVWGRATFLKLFKAALESITSTQTQRIERIVGIATRLADSRVISNATTLAAVSNLLDEALNGYTETTAYFRELGRKLPDPLRNPDESSKEQPEGKSQPKSDRFYFHLMRAHLSKSPLVHGDAPRNYRHDNDREQANVKVVKDRIRCEQVHLLFDSIDYFQDFMNEKGYPDKDLVKEAWMVLFFRGMCWSLCHTSDEEGTFLPAEFYGSRMPVFLI